MSSPSPTPALRGSAPPPLHRCSLSDALEVYCLNDGEARFLHDEIFVARSYTRCGITLRPGDVVLDVGANIGLFGIYLAHHHPGVRIHAFEPIDAIFEVLEANVALHGWQTTPSGTRCCPGARCSCSAVAAAARPWPSEPWGWAPRPSSPPSTPT